MEFSFIHKCNLGVRFNNNRIRSENRANIKTGKKCHDRWSCRNTRGSTTGWRTHSTIWRNSRLFCANIDSLTATYTIRNSLDLQANQSVNVGTFPRSNKSTNLHKDCWLFLTKICMPCSYLSWQLQLTWGKIDPFQQEKFGLGILLLQCFPPL